MYIVRYNPCMNTFTNHICVPGAARLFSLPCSFVVLSARLGLEGVEVVLTIWGGKAMEDGAQCKGGPVLGVKKCMTRTTTASVSAPLGSF